MKRDYEHAAIPDKLKTLLAIAREVQRGGKNVSEASVARARGARATHLESHDTVLIAAAFCMYNRYVDGLGTWQPQNASLYESMGEHLASKGYLQASVESS